MKQQEFVDKYQPFWLAFERQLAALEGIGKKDPDSCDDFPENYRKICQLAAVAKQRKYSPSIIERLNDQARRGHQHLYVNRSRMWRSFADFFAWQLPVTIRKHAKLFWLASLLFYGPLILTALFTYFEPDTVYHFFSRYEVLSFESMYDPSNDRIGRERDDGDDMLMFGHYVNNNTSIGFRTFAGGALGGIGALIIVVFNGVYIGAVAGHLTQVGYSETFYPFVIAHGSFELTAIVFSAMAGFLLGRSIYKPGQLSRKAAFLAAAKESMPIVFGAFAFFFIAAIIEAFWSSKSHLDIYLRLGVGAVLWVFVIGYLGFAGKRRGP